jgi:hypothetical protein
MHAFAGNVFSKTDILSQCERKVAVSARISSGTIDKKARILIYCAPHTPKQDVYRFRLQTVMSAPRFRLPAREDNLSRASRPGAAIALTGFV